MRPSSSRSIRANSWPSAGAARLPFAPPRARRRTPPSCARRARSSWPAPGGGRAAPMPSAPDCRAGGDGQGFVGELDAARRVGARHQHRRRACCGSARRSAAPRRAARRWPAPSDATRSRSTGRPMSKPTPGQRHHPALGDPGDEERLADLAGQVRRRRGRRRWPRRRRRRPGPRRTRAATARRGRARSICSVTSSRTRAAHVAASSKAPIDNECWPAASPADDAAAAVDQRAGRHQVVGPSRR